jgi:hypothetical protein
VEGGEEEGAEGEGWDGELRIESGLEFIRRLLLWPGAIGEEYWESVNADLRFLYLLYCLSCANGFNSKYALGRL